MRKIRTLITDNRAIWCGLIEQLIYDYVRSKYDNRLRKGLDRWPRSRRATSSLRNAGVEKVYSEKISGAITDRPALAKAIGALSNGDVLIVTKLDRLARSTRDLLNTLAAIGMLVHHSSHSVINGQIQQRHMGG